MAVETHLDVQLVACTTFRPPSGITWSCDPTTTDSEALVEFAGRACYETFDKPNVRTAKNDAYLRHIMEVGHLALLEHATASLYIRGLSRSAAHELMRHRHFSCSQLSQRFVHHEDSHVIIPPLIAEDPELRRLFLHAVDESRFAFTEILSALEEKLADEPNALLRKKQARQAARAVLPNATESRILVTGNFRTWRHFIGMRATEHADVEIRALAIRCLRLLRDQSPVLFGDFEESMLADGSYMATSPYVTDF
ncbi:FAD-dependent thymidylate synthase [Corynebacterium pseudotuberculosis]|uniref:Flavin-dependent thymidylate synthase n=2 Tax=Corynebacterium pseudotuberculosis TaxID=1719 RepID=D9QB11_CORP2|nr:FAD-dependent thymidylate synthase [Corynebacterium pseudotuberculosis]AER69310.1 Thymidylate synthase thyX [Corynebacterium pseudotuberculosis 1/06-A]ADK29062.1 FAD-dependent thymidylate synthase [Corynebacterium pseudotuberculosis FRC41]ADL10737.1 FAD-dependent thymidylate synthase [Corynebacterium pseudotuberculosis C231]ADL21145.1 FAD-dependent thymidylate synthase [Corynebacterium pseudotuberculosis 1002]ADO26537.1 FAD-dependent thymidylate synthase [Corynebacterium pseudotuberculosis 